MQTDYIIASLDQSEASKLRVDSDRNENKISCLPLMTSRLGHEPQKYYDAITINGVDAESPQPKGMTGKRVPQLTIRSSDDQL